MSKEEAESSEVTPIGWRNWVNLIAYSVNTAVTYSSLAGSLTRNIKAFKSYQILVTPADMDVWGPIFLWEGIFVVAQLFPRFRGRKLVAQMSPWWWALCSCQVAWTFAFTYHLGTLAFVFMLGILASLLGASWSTDGLHLTTLEYFLLPPYSGPLHMQVGWIIVASVLNVSAHLSSANAPQELLLDLSVVSNGVVLAAVAILTFDLNSPNPLIGVVAVSALAAIYSDSAQPANGNGSPRFHVPALQLMTSDGFMKGPLWIACLVISVIAFTFALLVATSRLRGNRCPSKSDSSNVDVEGTGAKSLWHRILKDMKD
mmetsp:Transcript_112510/g.195249  ORF Transcript_112510/g.195249 Transcript_112510/m.195249 type:complete len:315 (-) Transcript_112510:34-978(-)